MPLGQLALHQHCPRSFNVQLASTLWLQHSATTLEGSHAALTAAHLCCAEMVVSACGAYLREYRLLPGGTSWGSTPAKFKDIWTRSLCDWKTCFYFKDMNSKATSWSVLWGWDMCSPASSPFDESHEKYGSWRQMPALKG